MRENESYYIGPQSYPIIEEKADIIIQTGIKQKDAFHIACALYAECTFFITTDDRVLKYTCNEIQSVTPCEFIRRLEENDNV